MKPTFKMRGWLLTSFSIILRLVAMIYMKVFWQTHKLENQNVIIYTFEKSQNTLKEIWKWSGTLASNLMIWNTLCECLLPTWSFEADVLFPVSAEPIRKFRLICWIELFERKKKHKGEFEKIQLWVISECETWFPTSQLWKRKFLPT